MSGPVNDDYFIPVAIGGLEGFIVTDSEYFFLPCFPIKKCSLLKISRYFSLAPSPLPSSWTQRYRARSSCQLPLSKFQLVFLSLTFIQPAIISSALHEPV